ncbi:MAG: hypothetical protein H7Y17_10665 [Chlorobia bacterium]|nr:hypothetical protein [Fimbriimonadaceae bacterium]
MRLPWQKDSGKGPALLKGRAAVVPKSYKFTLGRAVHENEFTANSYSTVLTTVRVLKDGETAASVNARPPGSPNLTDQSFTEAEVEAQGFQRIQFEAPNWLGIIVSRENPDRREFIELPVWINPKTGRVESVDVPELIQQQGHLREEMSRHWGLFDGPFAEIHQLINAPKVIVEVGKTFASLPGTWLGDIKQRVKEMKEETSSTGDFPGEMPDLSLYPPVEGIDLANYVYLCFDPDHVARMGTTYEKYLAADKVWKARLAADNKLIAYFQHEFRKARSGG